MQHVYVIEINKGYALLVQSDSMEEAIQFTQTQIASYEKVLSARPAKREDFQVVKPFIPSHKK